MKYPQKPLKMNHFGRRFISVAEIGRVEAGVIICLIPYTQTKRRIHGWTVKQEPGCHVKGSMIAN